MGSIERTRVTAFVILSGSANLYFRDDLKHMIVIPWGSSYGDARQRGNSILNRSIIPLSPSELNCISIDEYCMDVYAIHVPRIRRKAKSPVRFINLKTMRITSMTDKGITLSIQGNRHLMPYWVIDVLKRVTEEGNIDTALGMIDLPDDMYTPPDIPRLKASLCEVLAEQGYEINELDDYPYNIHIGINEIFIANLRGFLSIIVSSKSRSGKYLRRFRSQLEKGNPSLLMSSAFLDHILYTI